MYFQDRICGLIVYPRLSAFHPGIAEAALTDSTFDRDAADGTRNRELIARIAALLGESEAAFFQGRSASECETAEMLRLWHRLASAADRRKLLALARTLAA